MATDLSSVGDLRSTGRKRARDVKLLALSESGGRYACEECGIGPVELPPTVSSKYPNIQLAEESRQVGLDERGANLQVDHADKDLTNCELSNLTLLCPSCHKNKDMETAPGVAQVGAKQRQESPFGYAIEVLSEAGYYLDDDPNFRDSNTWEQIQVQNWIEGPNQITNTGSNNPLDTE